MFEETATLGCIDTSRYIELLEEELTKRGDLIRKLTETKATLEKKVKTLMSKASKQSEAATQTATETVRLNPKPVTGASVGKRLLVCQVAKPKRGMRVCNEDGCDWLEETGNFKAHWRMRHYPKPYNAQTCSTAVTDFSLENVTRLREKHCEMIRQRKAARKELRKLAGKQ